MNEVAHIHKVKSYSRLQQPFNVSALSTHFFRET